MADYYLDWLAHPSYDDYWKQWSIEEHYSQIQVPALHVAAWYDLFQDGTLRNYLGDQSPWRQRCGPERPAVVDLVGGHSGPGPVIGEVDFGKESVFSEDAIVLRWYDYLLKGIDNGMGSEKPVKLFVMGRIFGVRRMAGPWRAPKRHATTCTPRAKPTHSAVTGR